MSLVLLLIAYCELSTSYRLACLTCSFSDKELGEYFQYKNRKAGLLPLKDAVAHFGVQNDGTWVLENHAHSSSAGASVPVKGSKYVWLGHILRGASVAAEYKCLSQWILQPIYCILCGNVVSVVRHTVLSLCAYNGRYVGYLNKLVEMLSILLASRPGQYVFDACSPCL